MGANTPTFYRDGARDFFKIGEKIGGGGVVANLQEVEGVAKNFHLSPPIFIALARPPDGISKHCKFK